MFPSICMAMVHRPLWSWVGNRCATTAVTVAVLLMTKYKGNPLSHREIDMRKSCRNADIIHIIHIIHMYNIVVIISCEAGLHIYGQAQSISIQACKLACHEYV